MKIWIVQGSTGEYSDREEWIVEAQATEEAAKARVARLEALMQEVGITRDIGYSQEAKAMIEAMKKHPEGDPNFSADYTGSRYWYVECELHGSIA